MLNKRLKRCNFEGLPDAVMLEKGQIRFKHYHITLHAIDRFVERTGRPADEIVVAIANAHLASFDRARTVGSRRIIKKTEEEGGYVLLDGGTYFIVIPSATSGHHAVKTVLTNKMLRHQYYS